MIWVTIGTAPEVVVIMVRGESNTSQRGHLEDRVTSTNFIMSKYGHLATVHAALLDCGER